LNLVAQVTPLIEKKSFDEVEAIWMSRMEADPSAINDFLEAARLLRKADERSRADALLDLLGDALKDRGLWLQRLTVLKELARLSKRPEKLRAPIEEAVRNAFANRPSLPKVLAKVKIGDNDGNPAEKAERIENWLTFDEGEVFFMPGRGVGVVGELNADLAVCRLDFEREKRVSVPLGAAQKFLTPISEKHLLRRKVTAQADLRSEAASNPSGTLERLLQDFGRPLTVSEVKDALIGVVDDSKWSSWWTSARKNPRVIVSGTGAKASYSWSESADAADETIRKKFQKAPLKEKLELAKKHSARSASLADEFSSTLAREAGTLAKSDPAGAYEILSNLEKLPGKYESSLDPASLLTAPLAARVVYAITDRALREKAIRTVRERHGEWPKVLGEVFFLEEDHRTISLIDSLLSEAGETGIRDRLIDETLRYPRRHPRAFYWYCKQLSDGGTIPDKYATVILQQMLDALHHDEFASLKAKFKEFFDRGGLAAKILLNNATEDQARKFVETLDRHGSLEEYRRELLKTAALTKFPNLRAPQEEPLYTTAERLAEKREEFERLKSVEIPANLKAIQEAREMGDLRENFEYKAARQRQEYLAARVTELQRELARVRVLNPSEVDTSEVRVGTKVALRNGDIQREVTILGPWESSPEHGVYSNQSDIAKAMMGKHTGDIVSFMGNDYEIVSIDRWS
jgi:transcription elongation factor GreA